MSNNTNDRQELADYLARSEFGLVAHGRSEDEACQAGTPGCAIDHVTDTPCGTW